MEQMEDITPLLQWMEEHLAKRAGIVSKEIEGFLDANWPKVIAWHELEEKELTEQSLQDNYSDLMDFLAKGEDEINWLMERGATGKVELSRGYECRKTRQQGILKGLAFVALFLVVAYKLGRQVFTFAFLAIAIAYTIILERKARRGEVKVL